jgi:hypothetical protein
VFDHRDLGRFGIGEKDMAGLSRYLFLLGGLPFVVFGLAHGFLMPLTPSQASWIVMTRTG